MSKIYEAEYLQNRIESHSHFNKCLTGYNYNDFVSKKNDLSKCRNCYNDIKNTETAIINSNLSKKNFEKELNNLKAITDKDIENVKKKLEALEVMIKLENENELQNLKNEEENNKLRRQYELEQLNKDLSNLKKENEIKKENFKNEIELRKKEELFKLTNEYEIKLLKYTNKLKLGKMEKIKENEIELKKFDADKEIELNELQEKAALVQKIISMCKNISLY